MTAFDKIKNSIEMTALVRSVITGNPEEVSLTDLKEEEYEQFAGIYFQKPYEAIKAMNNSIKRMKKNNARNRHIASAVDLECLVESDMLERLLGKCNESPVISGIKGYLMQGYTEMCGEYNNTLRKYQEKCRVDKRHISGILAACKKIAVEAEDEYAALSRVSELIAKTIRYNREDAEKIWKKDCDKTAMIHMFTNAKVGVCRHYAVLTQLALQEAGIKSKMQQGIERKIGEGHIWVMASINNKFILIDTAAEEPYLVRGSCEIDCYENARQAGRIEFIILNNHYHYYKYSTRGLQ